MPTILCIDDEPVVGAVLERQLAELGHEPLVVTSVSEALITLARQSVDLVISDYQMPDATGLDLLGRMRENGHEVPVIIMTGYSSIENAVLSMRHGAIDYLSKPLRAETLRIAVNNGIEVNRLRRENENFRRELDALRGPRMIVGESAALREVLDLIARVAPTRATVLLEGESGTGKELFARAIHDQSPRHAAPLITVNCAALPEGLVESALFGHERGAFTGAMARSAGAFERAHGGTLLLDEVSEMRLDLQAKLLRAIQEGEIERVGGTQPIKVDVRLVATTNRDLWVEAEAGRFRRDLYYRLNVVPVRTPPLRERREDIAILTRYFVEQSCVRLGIRAPEVPDETLDHLGTFDWPGNVRELANAVERAVIMNRGPKLLPAAFAILARGQRAPATENSNGNGSAHAHSNGRAATPAPSAEDATSVHLRTLEKLAIERALGMTGGHRTRAAELLGISERTLRNKLNGPTSNGE
jgi:DNA-binding NtrC family response regulator